MTAIIVLALLVALFCLSFPTIRELVATLRDNPIAVHSARQD